MPLVVKCDNGMVTDTYLEIIGDVFQSFGASVKYTNNIKTAYSEPKDKVIVVARTIHAFQLMRKGYRHIVLWCQGVEPEESYMSHKSKIRYWVLSLMEHYILTHAQFILFVSNEMRRHYEKKYSIKFDTSKYYCMPCMNTEIHIEAFQGTDKYKKNHFAYVGSLAPWQRFEDTVRVYKTIENAGIPNCMLRVFTAQKIDAERIVNENGVKNYSIEFVENEKLSEALVDVKYGFILREDTTVNRVATPTKISTYLSCGMIPVYSDCLKDFSECAKDMKYVVKCDSSLINKIQMFQNVDKCEILNEYSRIFKTYYSRSFHINKLKEKMKFLIDK